MQADVLHASADADHRALRWHAYLWDPWFLLWGLLLGAALWRARIARRRPESRRRGRAPGGAGTALLLARADGDRQQARIGDQTGGRVGFFLYTRDLAADRRRMLAGGVRFLAEPRREPYGTVAVFLDVYGNSWDLIEPT